jgi:hypothetical protein
MTEQGQSKPARKKTPADASEFEREQLRYFLSGDDLSATLATVNPSLAWLPWLSQMKLIQSEAQLIDWIQRNFADVDAVRDVVANLQYFTQETANFLEYRFNQQAESLSSLLRNSWALIIRHMRNSKKGVVLNEWFDIAPQLKRGEHGDVLLERLAQALRPTVNIKKRLSWYDKEEKTPERSSDLMSIDYEVEDGISSSDVLAAWSETLSPETDGRLLDQLTLALSAALSDATEAGVESNESYSTSDTDVPSVAKHGQNEYRSGFQVIVRVMAELWTRLARKSPSMAVEFTKRWYLSPYRLMRRMAMFAATNAAVPASVAANMLLNLPLGEVFLTSSSVEVHRLIRARWNEIDSDKQASIVLRILEGPPREWFREGAEIDRHVDRTRFELLGDMEREGLPIGERAATLLNQIRSRWPQWVPKPAEQAGFQVWHESGPRDTPGQPDKLKDVPDDRLVAEAKKIAAAADFMDNDRWQALCLGEPDRALRGLAAAASASDWPPSMWEQLLWSRTAYTEPETEKLIAQLLLDWPADSFAKISSAASSWLGEHVKTLPEALLWPLWDKSAEYSMVESVEEGDE